MPTPITEQLEKDEIIEEVKDESAFDEESKEDILKPDTKEAQEDGEDKTSILSDVEDAVEEDLIKDE